MQFKNYTKEFGKRIAHCIMAGSFSNRTLPSDLLLAEAKSKHLDEFIEFSLLVSKTDGTIFDAKFHCQGPPYVIGICELLCETFIRKTYAQLQHIGASYIEKLLEDKTKQVLEASCFSSINLAIEVIDLAAQQCLAIPVDNTYLETPIEEGIEENCIEDFFTKREAEQLAILNNVIEKQVQPYVAIDEGSVQITKIQDSVITIKYDGSCTSCIAATGSTLSAIQKILQTCVHPTLSVQVDPSSLSHAPATPMMN